jgi:hypothetical protein
MPHQRWFATVCLFAAFHAYACGSFGEASALPDASVPLNGADAAIAKVLDDSGADAADAEARRLGDCNTGTFAVCADFEHGPNVEQGGFTTTNVQAGGALAVAEESTGHFLVVDTLALRAGVPANASVLAEDVRTTGDVITMDASVRMPTKVGYAELLSLTTNGLVEVQFALYVNANGVLEVMEDGASTHVFPSEFTRVLGGSYIHARVEISFGATPTLQAWIDDAVFVRPTALSFITKRPSAVTFGAGVVFARGPSPSGKLHFDDVKLAFSAL